MHLKRQNHSIPSSLQKKKNDLKGEREFVPLARECWAFRPTLKRQQKSEDEVVVVTVDEKYGVLTQRIPEPQNLRLQKEM